jgi:hypothetical protein
VFRNPNYLELERQIQCEHFSSFHWFFDEQERRLLSFKTKVDGQQGCWLVKTAIEGKNNEEIVEETNGEFKKEWVSCFLGLGKGGRSDTGVYLLESRLTVIVTYCDT